MSEYLLLYMAGVLLVMTTLGLTFTIIRLLRRRRDYR